MTTTPQPRTISTSHQPPGVARKRHRQSGLAPLELALGLPLLAAILLVLLTILAALGAAARATYAVRFLAWADRDADANSDVTGPVDDETIAAWRPVLQAVPELGGIRSLSQPGAKTSYEPLSYLPSSLAERWPYASRKLALLHGSWDYRDIPFTGHGRLVLGNRVASCLATDDGGQRMLVAASAFARLLPADGGFTTASARP